MAKGYSDLTDEQLGHKVDVHLRMLENLIRELRRRDLSHPVMTSKDTAA